MKKYIMIIISITLLMFGGCSNKTKNNHESQNSAGNEIEARIIKSNNINITNGTKILVDTNELCDIIYFDSDQVVYMSTESYDEKLDTTNESFYHYDIKKKEITFITKVENFKMSFNNLVSLNKCVYYPFSAFKDNKQREYIMIISLEDLTMNIVQSNVIDSMVTRLDMTNDQIFRYYQSDVSDNETDFYIDKVNLSGADKTIIQAKYKEKGGEILVSSCAYENSIFTFSTKLDIGEKYIISEFNLEGSLLHEYQVDLNEFLKLKEVDDTDAIFRIFKVGDYFVLSTINNRVKILKLDEDELKTVQTPNSFEELLGANVIEDYGEGNEYMYFQSNIKNGEFYIFDSVACEIYEFNLDVDELHNYVIKRDNSGNIIVTVQEDGNKYSYYLIGKDTL